MKHLRPPRPANPPDLSAALLSTVGLMLLLLPVLMVSSSPVRLTSSSLQLIDAGGATPPHGGPLASIEVHADADALRIVALVQRADVRARPDEAERREVILPAVDSAPDLPGLQRALRRFSTLDPSQRRIAVRPADTLDVTSWVQLMDSVRADPQGPLFPDVTVEDPR
jgi:hypothetical protein